MSSTPIRPDMVKRAVTFLRHPKVKGAPQEKQMAFLKDKSLTTPVRRLRLELEIRVGVDSETECTTSTSYRSSQLLFSWYMPVRVRDLGSIPRATVHVPKSWACCRRSIACGYMFMCAC